MSAIPNLPQDVAATSFPSSSNGLKRHGQFDDANGAAKTYRPATDSTNGEKNLNGVSSDQRFALLDQPSDNFRRIRVIIIGAGFSGIYLGIRLPERIRNLDLVIYEKNEGVGGTWWENRYPGCACDVPAHSYQYSFFPNPAWSALYAPQEEIQAYLARAASEYGADRYIKLSHRVLSCEWNERTGKWKVRVTRDTKEQHSNEAQNQTREHHDLNGEIHEEEFVDEADVVISARGNLNEMAWPDIPGLNTFEGRIMHSAKWDDSFDFSNKRIGIVGNGSSAIQIIPSLQKLPGTEVSCFGRSKLWISPSFGQQLWDEMGLTSHKFSQEFIDKLCQSPDALQDFRIQVESGGNGNHGATIKGHPVQQFAQDMCEKHMKQRLVNRPDLFNSLKPSFAPGCRRLTPGPGFLEALQESNVDYIKKPIKAIKSNAVQLEDGSEVGQLDVLICATGFHVSEAPPFPVIGRESLSLAQRWKHFPDTYLSLVVDGFPNLFFMLGPNGAIGSGSLTMMIEATGDYIVKCVRKLQKENIRDMEVQRSRVEDFIEFANRYFEGTVYKDECRSWYRKGDRVTGLWPGSTLHCIETLRSPRWEDFNYCYAGDETLSDEIEENGERSSKRRRTARANRLAWLGNGWTANQLEGKHLGWYLYPDFIDKPVKERPEENERFEIRAFSH